MEQFTRNPAPLIVTTATRAGHLIVKVVEAVDYRIPFIPPTTPRQSKKSCSREHAPRGSRARSG